MEVKINEMGSCNFLSFFLSFFRVSMLVYVRVGSSPQRLLPMCSYNTVTGHPIHPSQARREERCIKKKHLPESATVTYCDINLKLHFTSALRMIDIYNPITPKKHREILPQTAIIQVTSPDREEHRLPYHA